MRLHVIADTHIGDPNADINLLKKMVREIAEDPSAYIILNGDLMNNSTKTSKGDVYSEILTPDEQIDRTVEIFYPVRHKILCMTHGNHEKRTQRTEGLDISKRIAKDLGVPYNSTGFLIFLRFGSQKTKETKSEKKRMVLYRIMVYHGSRGGRNAGSKMNALQQMRGIANADIYVHSHTHLPAVMKEGFLETDSQNSTIYNATKMFVNTASLLDYGGYGVEGEYIPSCKDNPVILLSGSKKDMKAVL